MKLSSDYIVECESLTGEPRAKNMQSKRSMAGGMPDWSSEEKERVLELFPLGEKNDLLKALPQRTWYAICCRARILGVERNSTFQLCVNIKTYKRPEIAPEVLGYIASFLDCEGSISVNKEKDSWHLHPNVCSANKNKEALDFMVEKIGFGNVGGGGHDGVFKLSFEAYNAIIVLLETVLPLLIVKKNQAQLMITFCKSRLNRLREGKRGYSEEEVFIAKKLTKYTMRDVEWSKFLCHRI